MLPTLAPFFVNLGWDIAHYEPDGMREEVRT